MGLQVGRIVYDGPPEGLTPDALTQIYGEEDWTAAEKKFQETGNGDSKPNPLDQDRLTGEG